MTERHWSPGLIANQDQRDAQVRELAAMVREHRRSGICDPDCPGSPVITALMVRHPWDWLDLLLAALVRIDNLDTAGPPTTGPLDPHGSNEPPPS